MNRQRPLILILLLVYISFPSVFNWLTNPVGLWYKPYLIWLLVIVVAFLIVHRKSRHDA